MPDSPTKRTLRYLRDLGYQADVVEHWNPHARIRQDLFGFIDVIAVSAAGTLAVQATSGSNVSSRVAKIESHPNLRAVLDAGWQVVVHGWRKNSKGRWVLREVEITNPATPQEEDA